MAELVPPLGEIESGPGVTILITNKTHAAGSTGRMCFIKRLSNIFRRVRSFLNAPLCFIR